MEASDEAGEARWAQWEVLIAALAVGHTDEQAAGLAGCSARTVRRWRHNEPEFEWRVRMARAERVASLVGRMVELGDRAVDTFRDALDDEGPRIRLRAAELILGLGARLRRDADVDNQIEELHAAVEALRRSLEEANEEIQRQP